MPDLPPKPFRVNLARWQARSQLLQKVAALKSTQFPCFSLAASDDVTPRMRIVIIWSASWRAEFTLLSDVEVITSRHNAFALEAFANLHSTTVTKPIAMGKDSKKKKDSRKDTPKKHRREGRESRREGEKDRSDRGHKEGRKEDRKEDRRTEGGKGEREHRSRSKDRRSRSSTPHHTPQRTTQPATQSAVSPKATQAPSQTQLGTGTQVNPFSNRPLNPLPNLAPAFAPAPLQFFQGAGPALGAFRHPPPPKKPPSAALGKPPASPHDPTHPAPATPAQQKRSRDEMSPAADEQERKREKRDRSRETASSQGGGSQGPPPSRITLTATNTTATTTVTTTAGSSHTALVSSDTAALRARGTSLQDTLRRAARAFNHVSPERVADALGINYGVSGSSDTF